MMFVLAPVLERELCLQLAVALTLLLEVELELVLTLKVVLKLALELVPQSQGALAMKGKDRPGTPGLSLDC